MQGTFQPGGQRMGLPPLQHIKCAPVAYYVLAEWSYFLPKYVYTLKVFCVPADLITPIKMVLPFFSDYILKTTGTPLKGYS
jgi:hypothetical protein